MNKLKLILPIVMVILSFSLLTYTVGAFPKAHFTSTASSAPVGVSISFDASSSYDDDFITHRVIVDYTWTFGDGATANGVTTSHAWATPGTYTVALTCTNDYGWQNTREVQVVINALNVVPEVPFGTIIASIAMALGIAGYFGLPKLHKRLR